MSSVFYPEGGRPEDRCSVCTAAANTQRLLPFEPSTRHQVTHCMRVCPTAPHIQSPCIPWTGGGVPPVCRQVKKWATRRGRNAATNKPHQEGGKEERKVYAETKRTGCTALTWRQQPGSGLVGPAAHTEHEDALGVPDDPGWLRSLPIHYPTLPHGCMLGGGGATPRFWTPTTPPTNCWPAP